MDTTLILQIGHVLMICALICLMIGQYNIMAYRGRHVHCLALTAVAVTMFVVVGMLVHYALGVSTKLSSFLHISNKPKYQLYKIL